MEELRQDQPKKELTQTEKEIQRARMTREELIANTEASKYVKPEGESVIEKKARMKRVNKMLDKRLKDAVGVKSEKLNDSFRKGVGTDE